jgi:hypothetical protein
MLTHVGHALVMLSLWQVLGSLSVDTHIGHTPQRGVGLRAILLQLLVPSLPCCPPWLQPPAHSEARRGQLWLQQKPLARLWPAQLPCLCYCQPASHTCRCCSKLPPSPRCRCCTWAPLHPPPSRSGTHLTRCPELAWCSWMASAMTRGALPGTGSRPQWGSTGPPAGPSSPVSPWISGHSSAAGRSRGRPWPWTTAAQANIQDEGVHGDAGVLCGNVLAGVVIL